MKHFIELNWKHFSKKCQQELENEPKFGFIKFLNIDQNQQQNLMDFQDISPSSPTDTQQNLSFSSKT